MDGKQRDHAVWIDLILSVLSTLLWARFVLLMLDSRIYAESVLETTQAWTAGWFLGVGGNVADGFYGLTNPLVWPINALLNQLFLLNPAYETAWFPALPGPQLLHILALGKIFPNVQPATVLPGVMDWAAPLSLVGWQAFLHGLFWLTQLVKTTFVQWGWVWLTEKTYASQQAEILQTTLAEQTKDKLTLSQDVATLSQTATLLRAQTVTDAMTGLYNKRFFQQKTTELFTDALTYQRPLGLMMLDIDHFKKLNDTYGHQTGDDVLKAVAKIIQQEVPRGCFACRYGGEEFGIIFPAIAKNKAIETATAIREAIAAKNFEGHPDLSVTISQGLAWFNLGEGEPVPYTQPTQWVEAADKALYASKEDGRNRLSVV
ncbi:MAG: GGDEF domain-containing protein [Vampirovibrionales bacterium]|nr:GGDEF domain-containing protein [Vampirovibrionales bacterium]